MSTKISASEVLSYLNYLGYNNINVQQLKEFIQDLKKLIKYEERKKLQQNSDSLEYQPALRENKKEKAINEKKNALTEEQISEIFDALYSKDTFSSRARTLQKHGNTILLQIKKKKCHHNCPQIENKSSKLVNTNAEKENSVPEADVVNTDRSSSNKKSTSSSKIKGNASRTYKSSNKKSDPVALYHYYESSWKRHKIPGEDNRTQLRWAIREKLMPDPRIVKAK